MPFTARIWPPGGEITEKENIIDAVWSPDSGKVMLVSEDGDRDVIEASLFGAWGDAKLWLEFEGEMKQYPHAVDPRRIPAGYMRFEREDGVTIDQYGELRRLKEIDD